MVSFFMVRYKLLVWFFSLARFAAMFLIVGAGSLRSFGSDSCIWLASGILFLFVDTGLLGHFDSVYIYWLATLPCFCLPSVARLFALFLINRYVSLRCFVSVTRFGSLRYSVSDRSNWLASLPCFCCIEVANLLSRLVKGPSGQGKRLNILGICWPLIGFQTRFVGI